MSHALMSRERGLGEKQGLAQGHMARLAEPDLTPASGSLQLPAADLITAFKDFPF